MAGIPNGTISHAKKSPSVDNLLKIFNAAPDLNREWALMGKGEMIIGNQGDNGNYIDHSTNGDNRQSVNVGADISVYLDVIDCLKQQLAEKDLQINQLISKLK